MGDLKPLGSEKLKADDKLKRILELTYYNNQHKPSSVTRAEHLSESNNGVYGIVREKDGYYVKKGLNENTLDYIGGMFMKNKNKFTSYAEALKRLELLKGQESLQEAETKYVLKTGSSAPAPQAEAPMPAPTTDAAPAPAPTDMPPSPADAAAAMPDALPPSDDASAEMGPDAEMGQEGGPEDYLKMIQKLTGKLGQKLRAAKEEMESDDIKYVINSVVSALNIDKLEPTDKEEILSKFEDEDEYTGEEQPTPEMGGEEMPAPSSPEDELGETMDRLDALVSAPAIGDDEDEDDYKDDYNSHKEIERPIVPGGAEDEFFRNRENGFTSDFDYDDEDDDEYGDMFKFDIKEEDPEYNPEYTRKDLEDNLPYLDRPGVENTENPHEISSLQPGGEVDKFYRSKDNVFNDPESDYWYDDDEDDEYSDLFKFDIKEEDPEAGEEDMSVHNPERYDTDVREIELSELTNMINQTVKETLGKYFKK